MAASPGAPEPLAVYGDAAYGAGALLVDLEKAGATVMVKVQPPVAPGGRYAKDRFIIDTGAATVTCPAKVSVPIRRVKAAGGTASFGAACAACPLAADFSLLAAAVNIGRLGVLKITKIAPSAPAMVPA